MKNISIILSLLALLFITACDDDDYTAPDTVTDVSWYTGIHPGELYAVNIGEYISFMDVSQGALSHEWSIEQGNNFLIPEFSPEDSLPLFINHEAGLSTDETTIHVLFNNTGINKVRLYNTFPDSVTYKGTIPYGAKLQGDVWVIDTLMEVDVYDHIQPAFDIYQDDVLVKSVLATDEPLEEDEPTWDTVYVEAGATLKYVDMTTIGRATDRAWFLSGGRFSVSAKTDSAATVHYYGLGSYTGTFTSSRGGDLPDASEKKLIPIVVKVIQSSQPFKAVEGTFVESKDEVISFNVSGELAAFADEEGNFTVHVENAITGFSEDIAVSKASVNSSDKTKLDLTLAAPIYNTDVVTVAYAGGNIQSVDERTLEPFTAQNVTMYLAPNSLDASWAGFDTYSSNWKAAFASGYWVGPSNGTDGNTYFTRVEGTASPNGKPCMSYISAGGVTNVALQGSKFKDMLPDMGTYTYQVSFQVYIEPGSNLSMITTPVLEPWTNLTWDLTGVEEGKWVTLKQVVNFGGVPTKRFDFKMVPVDNPGAGDVKLYFDNYSFILLEERQ